MIWAACSLLLCGLVHVTDSASPFPLAGGVPTPMTDPQNEEVALSYGPIKFMDNFYDTISVGYNGVISFMNAGVTTTTDQASQVSVNHDMGQTCQAIHGPFIAGAWTEYSAGIGTVDYYQSQDNDYFVNFLGSMVVGYFDNSRNGLSGKYKGTKFIFLARWKDVHGEGTGSETADRLNSFEILLISDGCQTYLVINYVGLLYDGVVGNAATSPIAAISGGLGGTSGDGNCLVFDGSNTKQFCDLAIQANANDDSRPVGWFVFRVDSTKLYRFTTANLILPVTICNNPNGLGCQGTCTATGMQCECSDNTLKNTVDCRTSGISWYDGCWYDLDKLTPCEFPCGRNKWCPSSCGGCGARWAPYVCDNCMPERKQAYEDCNVNKCTSPVERVPHHKRRGWRIQRNTKCCYSFKTSIPKKLKGRSRKSCCRPKVQGLTSGYICP